MLAHDLAGVAVFLIHNRQQQMLGRDKLVLHLIGLLLRGRKHLAQARTEILLPALHARKTSDRCLRVVEHDRDVGAELAENRSDNTFGLLEHRDKQVLRLDLLVLVSFGQFDRRLNCFLSP